jgi:fructose/tagatose bisphosphate aldolase
MNDYASLPELHQGLSGILDLDGRNGAKVLDAQRLRRDAIDNLAHAAVFAEEEAVRSAARETIGRAALALGIVPASTQALYEAMAAGRVSGFTVPALNLRALTYDSARAAFRAAVQLDVRAVIFEIARSEIGYTSIRPAEYAACIRAAAIKEGFQGPLFLQGDHFQVDSARFGQNSDKELEALRELVAEAIDADFLNIDIDSSTVVDMNQPSLREQQRLNYQLSSAFLRLIRSLEPSDATISVGVEIGEVGGRNTTPEEMHAFMAGLADELRGASVKGPSKISVQTGSSHGGVALPDGSVAEVAIGFDTLEELTRLARGYGMAGAVQHGASTLPDEMFHRFPQTGTAEIHLATGFQNLIYDSPHLPDSLRQEIYSDLKETCRAEWKDGQTEAQFIYKTRKKALGPFKRQLWDLPEEARHPIRDELAARFQYLFQQLNVVGTRKLISDSGAAIASGRQSPSKRTDRPLR